MGSLLDGTQAGDSVRSHFQRSSQTDCPIALFYVKHLYEGGTYN